MDKSQVGQAMTAIQNCMAMYNQQLTQQQVNGWLTALMPYTLDQITQGIADHISDGEGGRFKPMPAHIIAMINKRLPQGMTAQEAWGIASRQTDERATVLSCTWIDRAMYACNAILDHGDDIGGRMCFIDAYNRAAASGEPNVMRISLGHDPKERAEFIKAQVVARFITADYAAALLPAPEPTQAGVAIAGLLTGTAGKPNPEDRARFREIREAIANGTKNADDAKQKERESFAKQREELACQFEAIGGAA